MTPQQHLDRLIEFIQPPWTNNWWAWAKHRAAELAKEYPECAHLPAALFAERERIKAERKSSASEVSGTHAGSS